ncbi:hypothetical protein ACWGHM_16610 [Streptomyces sp. NPDC054904]|uniref:hypothetical protein n=1 Tax=unclassified Streptomyces TaxID=2593676 RepID=UPI002481F2E8|nr:hypothetical protein [Streptomyces sp. Isolate_45]MDA5280081.1 hypothetical protein [Streptomyces sp. Isolate_45]
MTYGEPPPVLRAAVDKPLPEDPEGEAAGARAYVAHIAADLGGYLFRPGRAALPGEALPELGG